MSINKLYLTKNKIIYYLNEFECELESEVTITNWDKTQTYSKTFILDRDVFVNALEIILKKRKSIEIMSEDCETLEIHFIESKI